MASAAESSVGSVPLFRLVQLQEDLLQYPCPQKPAATTAQQPEATDETHTSGVSATKDVETIPDSADVYNTPKSSPKAPPRLSSSKSAPATQIEAMIHPSPSQEAFTALTRASSFHGYPDGDTQPMESQVYRDYRESMVQPSFTTPKKTVLKAQISPEGRTTYDEVATGKTPNTCVEGETGFIDLENAWHQSSPTALSTSSNLNELLEDVQTQPSLVGSCAKRTLPETPAIAGNKHGRDGELLTSSTTNKKTPGFSQLFGGHKGQMMSATQLFNQTQAPSSPLLDAPRSDPIITRPSPTLEHQYSVSSPTVIMTSPVVNATSRPGTAAEPRDRYTSMRESQERRAVRFREELGLQWHANDDTLEELEEGNNIERIRFEQKRKQREMSDQAFQEWSKVRAPSRPGSRTISRPDSSPKPPTIDLVTPAPEKHQQMEFDMSDDGNSEVEHVTIEDEQPEDADPGDDEYDELAQTVLRSQGDVDEGEVEDEDENDQLVPNDVARPPKDVIDDKHEDNGLQQAQSNFNKQDDENLPRGTQHSAIADSQPGGSVIRRSLLPQQPVEPASTSLFVPGSQYAGRTSQDHQRTLSAPITRSKGLYAPATEDLRSNQVPSSPPLPPDTGGVEDDGAELSALGVSTTTKFQDVGVAHTVTVDEIPESDLPGIDTVRPTSSSPAAAKVAFERESNSVPPFSTAPTHLSTSGGSPQKTGVFVTPLGVFTSQQIADTSQSPRATTGIRHFAEIAATASPPKVHPEPSFDIDELMGEVVTADDQNFLEAVSSPPHDRVRKRRKIEHNTSKSILSPSMDLASNVPHRRAVEEEEPREQLIIQEITTSQKALSVNALRDSPSKGNEQPFSTPANDELEELTPDSVKRREEAGATAASQLLSERATKLTRPAKLLTYSKKAGRHDAPDEPSSVPVSGVKPKMKLKAPLKRKAHKSPVSSETGIEIDGTIQETNTVGHVPNERTIHQLNGGGDQALGEELSKEACALPVRAPNRVFALCKGSFNNFYPATWLGHGADGTTCRVIFDDETPTSILTKHVSRLELHIGDTIKVDQPGMRNKTWLIEGFADVAEDVTETASGDIHGRVSVRVRAKSTRYSSVGAKAGADGDGDIVEVAVSAIYLTHTMWSHFSHRTFNAPPMSSTATSRPATPSAGVLTPGADMSASRTGRPIIPTTKARNGRTSSLREEPWALVETNGTGLFCGMAFAISYVSNEIEKADVTRMIMRNGGIILENGFEELFSLPGIGESAQTSPTKKSSRKGSPSPPDINGLQLKAEYEDLGFVALIADKHSRKAKYMQALAIGLPTLSGKWIVDSVNSSKNLNFSSANTAPLSWEKYLLSAGESTYLGGAVRSRTIQVYDAAQARLSSVIENRDILLRGDGVLIVAPKKGKSNWDRRKTYAFLTLALGAGCVKHVTDLSEAKAFVADDSEKWKWVYVDGSVTEASATMFGSSKDGGKKRKRGEENTKVDSKAMSAAHGNVKIVNDEFVVQSLILGSLVD